jgi:uncharacterized protein (DUF1501 family)
MEMTIPQTFQQLSATLPAWMPRLAFNPQAQAARGDVLVCIFQRGGMDGLNVVVPVGDKNYYTLRPTIGITEPKPSDAKTAIDLDGYFALHPALAPLKPLYDSKALAIVHACGSPDPTHSHFDAMDFMERGTPGAKALTTGWLARHLASLNNSNQSPLRAVGIGTMVQESLRGEVPAVALRSLQTSTCAAAQMRLPRSKKHSPRFTLPSNPHCPPCKVLRRRSQISSSSSPK